MSQPNPNIHVVNARSGNTPPQGLPRPGTRLGRNPLDRLNSLGALAKAFVSELLGSFAAVAGMFLLMMYMGDLFDIPPFYLVFFGLWLIFAAAMFLGMLISPAGGGLNPTVTILMLARRRLNARFATVLIAGQLAGWLLAGVLFSTIHVGEVNPQAFQLSFRGHGLQVGAPGLNERAQAIGFGMPKPNPLIPEEVLPAPAQFLLELSLAAVLLTAVVICKARPSTGRITTAIVVGATVGFGVAAGMLTSGGALNPLVFTTASVLDWSFPLHQFILYVLAPLFAVPTVYLLARYTD